jgi:hypothetical protein
MTATARSLKVHIFSTDPQFKNPTIRRDWIGLIGSLVKAVEALVLWRFGPCILCWVSLCTWFYFFVCAMILQQQKLSRGYVKNLESGRMDIIAGQLPTARKRGEERKIFLGAPRNF